LWCLIFFLRFRRTEFFFMLMLPDWMRFNQGADRSARERTFRLKCSARLPGDFNLAVNKELNYTKAWSRERLESVSCCTLDAEVMVTVVSIDTETSRWSVIITHYTLLERINNVSELPVMLRIKYIFQHTLQRDRIASY